MVRKLTGLTAGTGPAKIGVDGDEQELDSIERTREYSRFIIFYGELNTGINMDDEDNKLWIK